MVVGFSLTGDFIPAGSGTLVELEFANGGAPCIDNLVLSGDAGASIEASIDCLSIVNECSDLDVAGLSATGGLNEVFLGWGASDCAASYNK